MSASSPQENVSPTTMSTPASTIQPTCSSNIARTAARPAASGEKAFVLQRFPADSVPVSRATVVAISSATRLSGSRRCSLSITRSFSRCP